MADIFISYSAHNRDKAWKLCEELRASGFSVWIDETNISAATLWSTEIVKAIESSAIFIILLSHHSFSSHNVIKELSLASEKKRHIIPVDLESAELPHEFQYQLAGLQRVAYKDYDRIEEAVRRFVGNPDNQKPLFSLAKKEEKRWLKFAIPIAIFTVLAGAYFLFFNKGKTTSQTMDPNEVKRLAVLPFENQSPDKENEFFAAGLADELIGTLSKLRGLSVIDRQTTYDYKNEKMQSLIEKLGIRYVVEGAVRKYENTLRIYVTLNDAETGQILWSEKYDGTIEDVFKFQESVANEITRNLRVTLSQKEKTGIQKKPTENSKAYELYLQAREYQYSETNEGLQHAKEFYQQAIQLDPKFALAYAWLGLYNTAAYWASGFKDTSFFVEAKKAADKALQLDSTIGETYEVFVSLYIRRGDFKTAIINAKKAIEYAPESPMGYKGLSVIYHIMNDYDNAIKTLNEGLVFNPSDLGLLEHRLWNLVTRDSISDSKELTDAFENALPYFKFYYNLHPDNSRRAFTYFMILCRLGKYEEAFQVTSRLDAKALESIESPEPDSFLHAIRNEPGFKALLKRMKDAKNHTR